jgi:dTDP-4-amino-4,6-dideoxygalactose transaminase
MFRWSDTSSLVGSGAITELEATVADHLGVRFALALPSATAAIQVGFEALAICPGDEVVVCQQDWYAAEAIARAMGAIPLVLDQLGGGSPSVAEVTALAGPATRAVVVTHDPREAAPVAELVAALRNSGSDAAVVEDLARMAWADLATLGVHGRVGVLSFGPGKAIDAGEGGVLVTDEEHLWREAVRTSQHPLRQLRAGIAAPNLRNVQRRMHPAAAVAALAEMQRTGWPVELSVACRWCDSANPRRKSAPAKIPGQGGGGIRPRPRGM